MSGFFWNPWHGCVRCSEGCAHCYVFALDKMRGTSTEIHRNRSSFTLPVQKTRAGEYRYPSGTVFPTCFTSDFFLEEADAWRAEAWQIIKKRPDCAFEFFTKRIQRAADCLPLDWEDGYDNVRITVSVENQRRADERIPLLLALPAKWRGLAVSPILEEIRIESYLQTEKINFVSAGGEAYEGARPCHFDWILSLREQCVSVGVPFVFHQTGEKFVKDGKTYVISSHRTQLAQARRAHVDFDGYQ